MSAIAWALKASRTRFDLQKSNEEPRLRCSATRTFSSTVRCGNTAEIWNERTRPSRATSAGAVGTDERVDGAPRNPQVHPVDRNEARELLGEILGLQDEFFTHHPCPML